MKTPPDDASLGQTRLAPSKRAGISQKALRDAIDAAEVEFRWCLGVLTDIKAGRGGGVGEVVIAFQPRLVDALFSLESVYGLIKQEERRLISRKALLNGRWFGQRMAALNRYCDILQNAIAVGRALGDGFAWMFYERDRHLVTEHLKHQRQLLLPTGVGGLGERMLVKNLKGFEKSLLVYHGTTSFLRLGDVSLVDLETMRVTAIGEIKTQRVNESEIIIRLELVADRSSHLPRASGDASAIPDLDLPPAMKSRYQRQLRKMDEAIVKVRGRGEDGLVGRAGAFYYGDLDEVVARSHHRHFEYTTAGPSLIIGAWRRPGRTSLARNLMHRATNVPAAIKGVEKHALTILDPKLEQNAIVTSGVGGGRKELALTADGLPLVWWQVSDSTLEDILFGNAMILTLYNPAHFWAALKSRGFEVTWGGGRSPESVKGTVNNRAIELGNYDYFNRLVQLSLMSLEAVLELVDVGLASSAKHAAGSSVRIKMQPQISRPPSVTGIRYIDQPAPEDFDVDLEA